MAAKSLNEHRVYCVYRNINALERIFGQKCDDEKLAELTRGMAEVGEYAREISLYMTWKPTPLSVKDLYSVYTIGGLTKIDPTETVNFWKMVRDEVKWRAENQIAAVGNERFRWMEAHPPSWLYEVLPLHGEYVAVCIGSQLRHMMAGSLINPTEALT